jgi:hypothetical protein
MASVVDIANLALGHIGDAATITGLYPAEGSPNAIHCARYYPIARDDLLERRRWSFATTRETLAELVLDTAGWEHTYAAPTNMLRPLDVYDPELGPTLTEKAVIKHNAIDKLHRGIK